jgi:hypothetical protein
MDSHSNNMGNHSHNSMDSHNNNMGNHSHNSMDSHSNNMGNHNMGSNSMVIQAGNTMHNRNRRIG